MSLRSRLARLETTRTTPHSGGGRLRPPEWWADRFAEWREQGFFDGEPDAPVAIRLHREAVERGDPEPVEWEWVAEMYDRIIKGKPAVTEGEYVRLAAWYDRNRCRGIQDPNITYMLYGYMNGPRRLGATEAVEKLRASKAAHPELTDDRPDSDSPATYGRQLGLPIVTEREGP